MNFSNNKNVTTFAIAAILLAALAGLFSVLVANRPAEAQTPQTETIEVEIAEDMYKFVFNQDVVFEDGMPAHGSNFITKGFVYPAGTLSASDSIYNGVNPDGSAEFPDKVIGEWVCYGYMIDDAMHMDESSGAVVVSKQYINFDDMQGGQMLVTEGYERFDDLISSRAITGGTGDYVGAEGQADQRFLGLNVTEGVTLAIELVVEK